MHAKGIFFDLYGTLLVYGNMKQAWSDWLSAFYDLLKERGLNLSKDAFALECDGFFSKAAPIGNDNDLTELERRIKSLGRQLNLKLDKNQLRPIADTIAGAWQTHISLDPDTIPVLKALKQNKKIGLVSNFDHPHHVRNVLAQYGLDLFFDTIVISSEVGVKKPDPAIFSLALQQTGLLQNEVIYVGDTDDDVAAAAAAGILPIFIARPINGTDSAALDYRADNRRKKPQIHFSSKNKVRVVNSLQEILIITNH
jgi:HAD superfamily hydrolase (TIGR01549 family)